MNLNLHYEVDEASTVLCEFLRSLTELKIITFRDFDNTPLHAPSERYYAKRGR